MTIVDDKLALGVDCKELDLGDEAPKLVVSQHSSGRQLSVEEEWVVDFADGPDNAFDPFGDLPVDPLS